MPNYRRNRIPGATYFFTVNLRDRRSGLLVAQIDALREAVRAVRRTATSPTAGEESRPRSRNHCPIAMWYREPDFAKARSAFGSVATGNTRSAMIAITRLTWITSISTRSSMVLLESQGLAVLQLSPVRRGGALSGGLGRRQRGTSAHRRAAKRRTARWAATKFATSEGRWSAPRPAMSAVAGTAGCTRPTLAPTRVGVSYEVHAGLVSSLR
jgi:hypothetical protein